MPKLYPYQEKIVARFANKAAIGLLLEAGAGKTAIAISILQRKINYHGDTLRTIIFAPQIVLDNWKREFALWSTIPEWRIGVVIGTKKARLKIITHPLHRILIVNYEATRNQDVFNALKDFEAEVVILDESHIVGSEKMKTPKGKPTLTGAVLKISSEAYCKMIMSGTPTSKPEKIWSQFLFLDPDVFGERYFSFKNKFFRNLNESWNSANSYPNWQFNPTQAPLYKRNIAKHAVSMKKAECISLPDLVSVPVFVEPSAAQKKHYNELKRELITWLDDNQDNPTVVSNALVKMLRLSEVLAGYLKLEDKTVVPIKNATLDALMDIIDSIGTAKVIIFVNFKQSYKDIAAALDKKKIKYVEIHGGVSAKDKFKNVDIFNDAENDTQAAIVNPDSGGVGINLRIAGFAIYYNIPASLIAFEQSRARNFRAGSVDFHSKITHYFLMHKGLLSEHRYNSMLNNKNLADSLTDIRNLL